MRQPEEIKKGLECCADKDMQWKNCEQCSYGSFGRCSTLLHEDALDYIQQLEAQVEKLEEQVGKDKDVHRKKRVCPTTGLECCECKPGGPCAKEDVK